MNWYHRVSVPWLEARRDVLTATDVVKLVPEYKRFKAKKVDASKISPVFAAVWCEKHTLTEPDPVSTGAAARGHFMEPYAIETYNNHFNERPFYHWDDCIITSNGLGFSPDACDVKQMFDTVKLVVNASQDQLVYMQDGKARIQPAPNSILEIKSYSPGQHMKSILKDKMDHDELMQIAVAFAVLPKLKKATLAFYCPDSPFPLHTFEYKRSDLNDQIQVASDIAMLYAAQAAKLEELKDTTPYITPVCSDAEVWKMEMSDDLGGTRI